MRLVWCAAVLVATGSAAPGVLDANDDVTATGFRNPAAVYCSEVLGYEYAVLETGAGQRGTCQMPDGTLCDDWEFLAGQCGAEFSYCARSGYGLETRSDGADPLSRQYAICVDAHGRGAEKVSVLTDLDSRSFGCEQWTPPPAEARGEPTRLSGQRTLPGAFDWRNHDGGDWLSPVKNQGGCGSCWAFCSVGVAEAAHNIAAGDPDLDLDLSEEYLVSDCFSGGDCCGGFHGFSYGALSFIRTSGIPDEACLSYGTSCSCGGNTCDSNCAYRTDGQCSDHTCSDRCADWTSRLRSFLHTSWVGSDPTVIKQALVEHGPLAVALGIGSGVGGSWDNGVYRCSNDDAINHGVVIVGYNDTGAYWIVRNSWGSGWDGDGYYNVGYGECAIEEYVFDAYGVATPGDVNADGAFDAADLSDLICELKDPTYTPIGDPDCTRDGHALVDDLTCILDLIH